MFILYMFEYFNFSLTYKHPHSAIKIRSRITFVRNSPIVRRSNLTIEVPCYFVVASRYFLVVSG